MLTKRPSELTFINAGNIRTTLSNVYSSGRCLLPRMIIPIDIAVMIKSSTTDNKLTSYPLKLKIARRLPKMPVQGQTDLCCQFCPSACQGNSIFSCV